MEKWLSQTLCGTGARTKLTCDRFPIKYQPSEIAWMSGLFNDESVACPLKGRMGLASGGTRCGLCAATERDWRQPLLYVGHGLASWSLARDSASLFLSFPIRNGDNDSYD